MKNKRLSGGDDFKVNLIGPGGRETLADLEDKGDGSYLVTYLVTAAGVHDLHVTIGQPALACAVTFGCNSLWTLQPRMLYRVKLVCNNDILERNYSLLAANKSDHLTARLLCRKRLACIPLTHSLTHSLTYSLTAESSEHTTTDKYSR